MALGCRLMGHAQNGTQRDLETDHQLEFWTVWAVQAARVSHFKGTYFYFIFIGKTNNALDIAL